MAGKMNKRGATPPQQGRIVRASSSPHAVASGSPPTVANPAPPQSGVRSGSPPNDVRIGPRSSANVGELNVRSGTDPSVPNMNRAPSINAKAGAAPVANMGAPGAGKFSSDTVNDQSRKGRNAYAKGGVVESVSNAMESVGRAIGSDKAKMIDAANKANAPDAQAGGSGNRASQISDAERKAGAYKKGGKVKDPGSTDGEAFESAAERKREAKGGDTDNMYARGGKVKQNGESQTRNAEDNDNDNAYARGGKVSRNSPVGEDSMGNGGIPGVASNIPLAQPGGTPSTGTIASGSMQPSWQGAATPQPGLRGPSVKRAGKAPSLMRPPR
jgi:hypothetical protein